jgi:hypothetical protein
MPPAGGDLTLTPSQQQKQLALMLGPLVGIEAEHHGRSTASLRDNEGLLPAPDTPENGGGVLAKVSNGNNFWDLCHFTYLLTYF